MVHRHSFNSLKASCPATSFPHQYPPPSHTGNQELHHINNTNSITLTSSSHNFVSFVFNYLEYNSFASFLPFFFLPFSPLFSLSSSFELRVLLFLSITARLYSPPLLLVFKLDIVLKHLPKSHVISSFSVGFLGSLLVSPASDGHFFRLLTFHFFVPVIYFSYVIILPGTYGKMNRYDVLIAFLCKSTPNTAFLSFSTANFLVQATILFLDQFIWPPEWIPPSYSVSLHSFRT